MSNNSSVTYTTLLADLRRYLERGFTQDSDPLVYEQLPRLITLAERRIARELKVEGFLRLGHSNQFYHRLLARYVVVWFVVGSCAIFEK